jgi:uncharacterized YccA/Bax inhibitor family protein
MANLHSQTSSSSSSYASHVNSHDSGMQSLQPHMATNHAWAAWLFSGTTSPSQGTRPMTLADVLTLAGMDLSCLLLWTGTLDFLVTMLDTYGQTWTLLMYLLNRHFIS